MSAVRLPNSSDDPVVPAANASAVAPAAAPSLDHPAVPTLGRFAGLATSGWLLFPAVCFLLILPFSHTVAARLTFLVLTGACAIVAWRRWGGPQVPGMLVTAWCLYSGWALLSVLWSFAPAYSLTEVKDEIGYGLFAFLAMLVLVRSSRDFLILHGAVFAGFAICTLIGLSKVASGLVWDSEGIHGGSNNFSVWLVILAPSLVWMAFTLRKHWFRVGLVALAALFLAGTYFAEQRATWPVLGGEAVLLSALLLWRRPWSTGRKLTWILSVCILALLITPIGFAKRMNVSYWEAATSLKDTVVDDVRPRDIWQMSREVLRQRPLVGAGFGRIIAPRAYPELHLHRAWHAHNLVLSRTVQLGWIGAVLFLGMMGAIVLWLFRRYRQAGDDNTAVLAACALTTVVGMFAVNMTNDAFVRHTSLLFWSLAGMWLALLVHRSNTPAAASAEST